MIHELAQSHSPWEYDGGMAARHRSCLRRGIVVPVRASSAGATPEGEGKYRYDLITRLACRPHVQHPENVFGDSRYWNRRQDADASAHIGLETTRIRSLSGEQIIVANADLLKSRIRYFKKMYERRVEFSFRVVYNTPFERLQRIPTIIRSVIEQQAKTRFDRVHFKEYGESALIFEIVYFVLDADFNIYMDIQQAINLSIFQHFQEQGIVFAYPTRTLYVIQAETPARANRSEENSE